MALDRWIALIIALVFLIYGHTAFFGMDDLLPPILKRNPIWPSTFPKILSVVGVLALDPSHSVVAAGTTAGYQVGTFNGMYGVKWSVPGSFESGAFE